MSIDKTRAIGLLSGGLDSILAVKVLQGQGVHVIGLSFKTPFFQPAMAKRAASMLGIKLIIKDITRPHLRIVKDPPHGYGSTMNPCIDCHAYMVREARKVMRKMKFDFIFTGEVLNERPMSQNRQSLDIVRRASGSPERLLRPLSAGLLPETEPERLGKVDRSRLLDIEGRSRKRQIALARHYGIKEYPAPAGGCLLTDPGFSKRLKDLFTNSSPKPSVRNIELLKYGRHFRLSPYCKLIVGRNEKENRAIRRLAQPADIVVSAEHIPGPVGLLSGNKPRRYLGESARTVLSYSDSREDEEKLIYVKIGNKRSKIPLRVDKQFRFSEKKL
ncbi:MAG: tRNA 4-thiouridine(8) synthase ThiI [Candidatus Omnitrophica bacterium]|nr:tRNA 4-thiouridine(8) synthase ThiI [Candidatus Omnitrophota bacterium]